MKRNFYVSSVLLADYVVVVAGRGVLLYHYCGATAAFAAVTRVRRVLFVKIGNIEAHRHFCSRSSKFRPVCEP